MWSKTLVGHQEGFPQLGATTSKAKPKMQPLSKQIIFFQIFVSSKWGFTKFERPEYEKMIAPGHLKSDGVSVKYFPEHGPLKKWKKTKIELAGII